MVEVSMLPCMALFFSVNFYRAGLLTIQKWYDLILHNCSAGSRNVINRYILCPLQNKTQQTFLLT